MNLFDLNFDVLENICSYLYGQDALNFALSCKSARELAISRIDAVTVCNSTVKLCKLWTCMDDERAQHIRSFSLSAGAFEVESGHRGRRICPDYAEFASDILEAAHTLHHLRVDLSALLVLNARIQRAVCGMHNLIHLELHQFTSGAIPLIRNLSGSLRMLHIDYHNASTPEPPDLGALFTAALFHRTLQSLSVLVPPYFRPRRPTPLFIPPHTALRTLIFPVTGTLPPEVLASAFHLDVLVLGHEVSSLPYDHDFLPPLRHLSIAAADLVNLLLEGRLPSARYLHIGEHYMDGTSLRVFWDIIKQISPLGLHLHCNFSLNCAELAALRDAAPELRCLTITVGEKRLSAFICRGGKEQTIRWLHDMPEVFASLPITCLRLHLAVHSIPYCFTLPDLYTAKNAVDPIQDLVATLQARLARAVPSLRYIAVSPAVLPDMEHCSAAPYDCHDNKYQASTYWWRVRTPEGGEGAGNDLGAREVERVSWEEGVRVWRAVMDAPSRKDVAEVIRKAAM